MEFDMAQLVEQLADFELEASQVSRSETYTRPEHIEMDGDTENWCEFSIICCQMPWNTARRR